MVDQPSREPTTPTESGNEQTTDGTPSGNSAVDDDLKRRLEEAYLNEGSEVLVVRQVRSVHEGGEVVVEMEPPHGGATHTERFDGPKHGSLDECEELVSFLQAAGVSPLELDDLVGTRIPATFDPDHGWRLDDTYVRGERRGDSPGQRVRRWLRTYRDWLLVILIVGVELLFVVVLILVFA